MGIVFVFSAVLLIGFCAWQIITTLQERHLSKQEYERTRESYVSVFEGKEDEEEFVWNYEEPETEKEEEEYFPQISVDIEGLLKQNPDFVAWLYYADGAVSYPVVQETKAKINKYMKTTFEGKPNPSGCIFIPYDADPSFRFMNTFLYGHNMANGSMFGTLKKVYQDPSKALDPYFYIWTKDYLVIKYRVIAVYVVDKDSEMFSVPLSEEGYAEYLGKVLSYGAFNKYTLFTDAEKTAMKNAKPIVTLSTCYGAAGTPKRLLVQGVEIVRKDAK